MITIFKPWLVTVSLIFLSACGAIQCVDSQFERDPIPVPGKYQFKVSLPNGVSNLHTIRCERYYDAICAERGNSWKFREVGKKSGYKLSHLAIAKSEFDIELPTCRKLNKINGQLSMKDIIVAKNNALNETVNNRFVYVSSLNGVHRFKSGGAPGVPIKYVELEFDLQLNGVSLESTNL